MRLSEFINDVPRMDLFVKGFRKIKERFGRRARLEGYPYEDEDEGRVFFIEVMDIKKNGKGKKIGKLLSRTITHLADETHIILTMVPDAQAEYELHNTLIKLGFETTGDNMFRREPK